jgi:hypothetical protein
MAWILSKPLHNPVPNLELLKQKSDQLMVILCQLLTIIFPPLHRILQPLGAGDVGQFLALEVDQAFDGGPVAAGFAQQVVVESCLLQGLVEQIFRRVGLAGQAAEKVPDFGGKALGMGFKRLRFARLVIVWFVQVDAAVGAAR